VGAAQSEFHRDNATGHVADEHWNGKGGDALRTFVHQRAELVFDRFQSADAAADDHAEAIAIDLLYVDAAILDRHLGGSHGQLNETIGTPYVFDVVEKVFWIEVAYFTADFAIVVGGVEGLDPADAAFAFNEIFPKRLEIVADRRDNAEASNNNSAVAVHSMVESLNAQRVPMPTLCTAWKSFPSVLIEGAMMISVCWNSGRLRAPTLPMQVVIAPTRFWLPSST